MQNSGQISVQARTGKRTGIWLALVVALAMHAMFLLLPVRDQKPAANETRVQIELQLTTLKPPPSAPQTQTQRPATPPPLPVPKHEPPIEPQESLVETQAEATPPLPATVPQARKLERDPEKMNEQARARLTSSILTRQFISEEPAADKLFGRLIEQNSSELQKEFHYPLRQNMLAMLDQPMPELPFAYQSGLVNFAYDPGVKGDLQRFWDVITPEFGWRTKNGTEFKCVWVLIIAGCGWK
jgi:type IV secretory pathway VirB10-like protein